jgi:hemoglobin
LKKDILNRSDIELMISAFYNKVKSDKLIGFLFTDIVKVNWESHLPIMCNFWENALFFSGNYTGNPMNLHQHLQHIQPLESKHFTRWVSIFVKVVDANFKGSTATLAKQRAKSIAKLIEEKVLLHRFDH